MKLKYLLSIVSCCSIHSFALANNAQDLYKQAQEAYDMDAYPKAASLYEKACDA